MTPNELYLATRIAFGWRFTSAPLCRFIFIGANLEQAIKTLRRAYARHALN